MVALTGELGEPPDRIVDLWRLDELRGIALDGDAISPRGADDVHGDPPLGALPRASPRAGRGGRDDRRGPDPEPRHARRQRRQRLAGRRHAAGPARARRRRSCSARPAASGRSRRASSGPPTGGRRSPPTSSSLRIRIPLAAGPRGPLPQGRDAPRPVDQQGRAGARLARRRRGGARGPTSGWRSGPWRPPRSGRAATEAALEGRPPTPETADRAAETLAGELHPIDDVRSTAEYRRLVAARVLHRLIREAGGW